MKRIGFFGGTFDPPHKGHLTLAQTAMRDMALDQVLWVLTPQSPLKTTVYSTLDQRIAMVNFCLANEDGMLLSMVDIEREPPYYTVDTAQYIRNTYADPVFLYFILGGDSLRNMVKWHQARELIFERVDGLIVARRPGDDLDCQSLEYVMPGIMERTHFIDMAVMDISSYKIRQAIAEGKSVEGSMDKCVEQFIHDQELYLQDCYNSKETEE